MTYETILISDSREIVRVTLNRPQVLHALNSQMFHELQDVFEQLAHQEEVRVILLTGFGEKAFAAGADLRELENTDARTGKEMAERGQAVFSLIESCGKPVIALINGFALGGGCELSMACTLRIASASAKLGQPEVKLGLIPGYGGTQRLPRLIGRSAALKLLLTGEIIAAEEALRLGLLDEVVPSDRLLERGEELARTIVAGAPLAQNACLEAVRRGGDVGLAEALEIEASIFGRLCGTADKAEGIAAFLEKRLPAWRRR